MSLALVPCAGAYPADGRARADSTEQVVGLAVLAVAVALLGLTVRARATMASQVPLLRPQSLSPPSSPPGSPPSSPSLSGSPSRSAPATKGKNGRRAERDIARARGHQWRQAVSVFLEKRPRVREGLAHWLRRARFLRRVRSAALRASLQHWVQRARAARSARDYQAICSARPEPEPNTGSLDRVPHRIPNAGLGNPRFHQESRRPSLGSRGLFSERGPRPGPHTGPRTELAPPTLPDDMRLGTATLNRSGWETIY